MAGWLATVQTLRHSRRALPSRRQLARTTYATQTTAKPFYITTPIFYPNAEPHIGHLHSLLLADVFARFVRYKNPTQRVELVTGTDEHGLKIQKAAADRGITPIELCDEKSRAFKKLAQVANISYTTFIRTTEQEHEDGVVHLWNELAKRDLIYKATHSGWYSISDECFYTEGQTSFKVETDASGVQNEVRIATETGNVVEWTEELNYKFRLSKFRELLLRQLKLNPSTIYPPHQYAVVLSALSSPANVEDLSVSRPSSRLSWGISVPGDSSQTIYVWIDALTSYLTAVGYPWVSHRGTIAWPPDLQIIGKDILRFHAHHLPSILLALGLPLPRRLLAHSHWTANKVKMSKSLGNVVNPMSEIEEHGVDVVRWYLCRVGGNGKGDVDWSKEQLKKHEEELRSLVGNLYSRLQGQKIARKLPEPFQSIPLDREVLSRTLQITDSDELNEKDSTFLQLKSNLETLETRVCQSLDNLEAGEALQLIVDVLKSTNRFFTAHAPWLSSSSESDIVNCVVWTRESLRICSILLQPFIPSKAAELLDALRVKGEQRLYDFARIGDGEVLEGKKGKMLEGVVLFPSLEMRHRLEIEEDFRDEGNADLRKKKTHRGSKRTKLNPLYAPFPLLSKQRESPARKHLAAVHRERMAWRNRRKKTYS